MTAEFTKANASQFERQRRKTAEQDDLRGPSKCHREPFPFSTFPTSFSSFSPAAIDQLTADAGVRLHVPVTGKDGLLEAERIRREVPGWESASFWFCRPLAFGQSLRADFIAHGPPADFTSNSSQCVETLGTERRRARK